jgi:hypothetical protein
MTNPNIDDFPITVNGLGINAIPENVVMTWNGRPTEYKPEYCDVVIDMMSKGYTKTAVAGYLMVTMERLIKWEIDNPEFHESFKIGQNRRVGFLETGRIAAATAPMVTSRIFALKGGGCAAAREFRDDTLLIDENGETIDQASQSAGKPLVSVNINFKRADNSTCSETVNDYAAESSDSVEDD